jgi:hypothetical protein
MNYITQRLKNCGSLRQLVGRKLHGTDTAVMEISRSLTSATDEYSYSSSQRLLTTSTKHLLVISGDI